jgi:hypothetical protein
MSLQADIYDNTMMLLITMKVVTCACYYSMLLPTMTSLRKVKRIPYPGLSSLSTTSFRSVLANPLCEWQLSVSGSLQVGHWLEIRWELARLVSAQNLPVGLASGVPGCHSQINYLWHVLYHLKKKKTLRGYRPCVARILASRSRARHAFSQTFCHELITHLVLQLVHHVKVWS